MEKTSQLRSEGNLSEAASIMENGLRGLPKDTVAPLQLELADMFGELQEIEKAQNLYVGLLDGAAEQRLVRSGLAQTYIQQERWEEAREALSPLPIGDITGTEIHMMMFINQQAPSAEGLELQINGPLKHQS